MAMAKRQSKPFKASAKLRKALSGFAAGHEQPGKLAAAAVATPPAPLRRAGRRWAGRCG